MKKILGLLCISVVLFAQEIPSEIEEKISKNIRNTGGSYSEQQRELEWVKNSYKKLHKRLDESGLTQEEQNRIEERLNAMYGYNYIQQSIKVKTEISDYQELKMMAKASVLTENMEKEVQEKEKRNVESEEKVSQILTATQIPVFVIERLKSEAERLYSGDYYEQERYLESSIENYKLFKK